jgi:hypothetical protein
MARWWGRGQGSVTELGCVLVTAGSTWSQVGGLTRGIALAFWPWTWGGAGGQLPLGPTLGHSCISLPADSYLRDSLLQTCSPNGPHPSATSFSFQSLRLLGGGVYHRT